MPLIAVRRWLISSDISRLTQGSAQKTARGISVHFARCSGAVRIAHHNAPETKAFGWEENRVAYRFLRVPALIRALVYQCASSAQAPAIFGANELGDRSLWSTESNALTITFNNATIGKSESNLMRVITIIYN